MQESRYELKYLITEITAGRVRDLVRCYLDIDEFGRGRADSSYPVHSLYLDSNSLELYWQTVNGDKNRFKLRVRYYIDSPDAPVFFEIKRRIKDIIQKQRGGIRRPAAELLLNGQLPAPEHLVDRDPKSLVAVQRFCTLATELQARPRSHISYQREAYRSEDDAVRVTLDREVYSEPQFGSILRFHMEKPVRSFKNLVVLEIKFTRRFPNWLRELVRMANISQTGAAKYVSGVSQLGRRRLKAHAEVLEEESLLSTFRAGDDLPAFIRDDKSSRTNPPRS